jgi:hypothetical protein
MVVHLLSCKLLLASAASVLAGALLRTALALMARRLPAMTQRRTIWMAAQCTVAPPPLPSRWRRKRRN